MALALQSAAFGEGELIPSRHTCDGVNSSPPLTWTRVPDEAKSLALILEDIDSVKGTWSHWVLYDLPPDVEALPGAIPPSEPLLWGGFQGQNDFDEVGYGGPCPSDGKTHRYVVRLYALDQELGLDPGVRREVVLDAIEGHVIEEAELMGHYTRLADR